MSLGGALYRAGRYQGAAKTLADADTAYQREQTTPTPGIYVTTTISSCRLFLAMTHQRLDHQVEAEQWLKKAVEVIDHPADPSRTCQQVTNSQASLEAVITRLH
jgi:hypothetical protein